MGIKFYHTHTKLDLIKQGTLRVPFTWPWRKIQWAYYGMIKLALIKDRAGQEVGTVPDVNRDWSRHYSIGWYVRLLPL